MGGGHMDGEDARIDYSKDGSQGCRHYVGSTQGDFVSGNPRTTEPQKTWLDECAIHALGVMYIAMAQGYWTPGENPNNELAESSYQIADAMLSEKMKRDAKF